ncbi:MAG: methyltransferase domain-containing protein [Endomicrobiia bacterium]|nr:methyltransferase domain-containing protein [Endomicrobiia bacterium]
MKTVPAIPKQAVKEANRKLYDDMARDYERIDGRRTPELAEWLRSNLDDIRRIAPGGNLLDIGAGSGFVTRCAEGIFDNRVGVDLSRKILAESSGTFDMGVCADVDNLPFADGAFDAATCFAVLHHMYDYGGLVSEMARVLKPGGVFYSDHDLDFAFRRNFAAPIALYRMFKDKGTRKKLSDINASYDDYALSEFRSDGVPSEEIAELFRKAGFKVKVKYHWFGVFASADPVIGRLSLPGGLAPLLSIRAVKKG